MLEAKIVERVHGVSGLIVCACLISIEWLVSAMLKLSLYFSLGILFSVFGLHCYRVIAESMIGLRKLSSAQGIAYLSAKIVLLVAFVVFLSNVGRVEALITFLGSLYVIPVVITLGCLGQKE